MIPILSIEDISAAIQVAIAPIFLLVGTGSLLNVVTARLGRVIDRARKLEELIEGGESADKERRHLQELKVLDRRMRLGNRAVLFCSLSAVLICILVGLVFVLGFFGETAGILIAVLFVIVMAALATGLISFLMEVSIATNLLRVRHEFLTGRYKENKTAQAD
ncbi:DUF2721 domain-containing protein [Ponticaulis sp.]|uniref:DUF2721 domain-containing protein n=1 Tax=Ponticaulis sp. TaxID=2020902 RepID=UPI0025E24AB6|nr:DUF2721 domain-containing protein [Ponticaulis sp.]|tara:strand:+ start:178023 stop:178511 length:489 start_codon:yes stop_codon:yes gene_type:complete